MAYTLVEYENHNPLFEAVADYFLMEFWVRQAMEKPLSGEERDAMRGAQSILMPRMK